MAGGGGFTLPSWNADLSPVNMAAPRSQGPQGQADIATLSTALNLPTQVLQLWGPRQRRPVTVAEACSP